MRMPDAGGGGHYIGQLAALGTMHGKEAAIAPPLYQTLGLRITVPELDTDCFGTFTGEIPRIGTMLETAERKARAAIKASGLPLGLGSEGSFGPHPSLPLVPAAIEFLVFVDTERDLVVADRLVTTATNFAHVLVAGGEDATAFLRRCGFPEHAVIVRPAVLPDGMNQVVKGIRDKEHVLASVEICRGLSLDGKVRLETDMRAHLNPTRMSTLQQLAAQLAARLALTCPSCNSPGFGIIGRRRGLPCSDCGSLTEIPVADVYGCAGCSYVDEVAASNVDTLADPRWCPVCNP